MKKYLFILLLTIAGYGQTLQNPTFGTVTSKTNVEDNYAEKVLVQNSLGKLNWIYKNSLVPDNYTKVVYVNNNNPNGATVFDLNNPPVTNDNLLKSDVNNLYIGTDASTWVYNATTVNYVTKTVTSNTSNFYLSGTSTDAGNTKTASVYRTGKISVGADVSSSDAFTVTGNSKFIGLAKIGDNPVGSASNRITQKVGSDDDWSIYGEATVIDQGKLIFEVGDNGLPISSNGQSFQFRYNNVSSGVAKNPLTIDYNDITALANVTATSFIKSGAIATHALLAGGGTLANPIGGTGVANNLGKWTGSGTQGGSDIFDNGAGIGFGLASYDPYSQSATNQFTFVNKSTNQATRLNILGNGTGMPSLSFGMGTARHSLMSLDSSGNFTIFANPFSSGIMSTEMIKLYKTGNLVIQNGGTFTDNGSILQVTGNIAATSYSGTATLTGNPTAPTPTAGDNDTSIATTAFVQANARPYKVYVAVLNQTGTSAPVATVIENTLGGTVVWSYVALGVYDATLTGAFNSAKTAVFFNKGEVNGTVSGKSGAFAHTLNTVRVITVSNGFSADGEVRNSTIEIRVYP
jgi:hypothetical protein